VLGRAIREQKQLLATVRQGRKGVNNQQMSFGTTRKAHAGMGHEEQSRAGQAGIGSLTR